MKKPKTVKIKGLTWTIKYCDTPTLGHICHKDRVISIDNTSDDDRQKEILLHEIMEACMVENGLAFTSYPGALDDGRVFVMRHSEFRTFCKDVYSAVKSCF